MTSFCVAVEMVPRKPARQGQGAVCINVSDVGV